MQVECWTTGLDEARLPPCSQIPQDQQRVKDTLERLQTKSDNDDNQSSELTPLAGDFFKFGKILGRLLKFIIILYVGKIINFILR